MADLPKTRSEAKAAGSKHYFTGKPCINGHLARKFTSNGSCEPCELQRTQRWRETPENKEKVRAGNRARDPKQRAVYNRERKRQKRLRTPTWADKEAIKFFYECRPTGCHVDHIIPLLGKTVSGLHIETNLAWVPAMVNIQKRNTFVATAAGG